MSLWVLLKFLHVASAMAVVAIQIGSDFYFQRVTGSGSTEAVARLGEAIRKRTFVEAVIFEITIVLGLLTAIFGNVNLLSGWLLLAYADIAVIFVIAMRYAAAPFTAILEAAQAGDAAAMAAAARAPARMRVLYGYAALVAFLVFLMVVKPI